jgi:predicted AlkP superfamily phosphohydrolase/phosphomutase
MPVPARRILVIGLDGATFDLFDRWFEAGELPFLRGMAQRGLRAPLTSVFPAKTIPAWYSFATGLDPGSLGVFGFTEPNGGPGRSRLVQTFRPAEAIWDRLSRHGTTVGVLNFPLRAPYPIKGFVVPGMLAERSSTYPDELRGQVEQELGERFIPELPPYRDADRRAWVDLARRGVAQRARVAEILIRQYRPEFLFVLFRETDRMQHQHWGELVQPMDRVGADLKEFYRAVDTACARVDAAFRTAGGPSTTLVISDHGHGAARSDFFTNQWLAKEGYLKFTSGAYPLRRQTLGRAIVAADRVPGLRGLLHRLADKARTSPRTAALSVALTGEASFEAAARRIDWARSVAFSYPVPEGIYLNRWNPQVSGAEGERLVEEIRGKLRAFDGAHIEVFRPEELYQGRLLERAPALLLRIDRMQTEPRMDFSYPDPMLHQRPAYYYGSGVHRMDGILLAASDGIGPERMEARSLLDIAPTVLEAMGVVVPPTLGGRSFADRLGPRGG